MEKASDTGVRENRERPWKVEAVVPARPQVREAREARLLRVRRAGALAVMAKRLVDHRLAEVGVAPAFRQAVAMAAAVVQVRDTAQLGIPEDIPA